MQTSQGREEEDINTNLATILEEDEEGYGEKESAISTKRDSNIEDLEVGQADQHETMKEQEEKQNEDLGGSETDEAAISILTRGGALKYHLVRKCRRRR